MYTKFISIVFPMYRPYFHRYVLIKIMPKQKDLPLVWLGGGPSI